jgi:hypothetical protein
MNFLGQKVNKSKQFLGLVTDKSGLWGWISKA